MIQINQNYNHLKESYLFSEIAARVRTYQEQHPQARIIRLGIGDVTLPLCKAVTNAMEEAVQEMGRRESFHGYGPEQGYGFLKTAIGSYYASYGVELTEEEIFVSDGAKSDLGNILDLFAAENTVLIPDPVYPVYVDTNLMAGRKILYMDANKENGFLPLPDPAVKADLIYLCSPNNPTGAVYNREQLKQWVDYANENGSIILFDAAYEAFIGEPQLPKSIFEISGAKTCAIEFCSFSKTAGFTGTRCGYTVIPEQLERQGKSLNKMWLRRQTTKFNGVPYIVQKGAAAVFTPEGKKQIQENLTYYKENAKMIAEAMQWMGISYTGGKNSPYIWLACPNQMKSWAFFDLLLEKANIVGTPGSGFGSNGEGFFRLTGFGTREDAAEAVRRMEALF